MFWLKVDRSFYNLDRVTQIEYSFEGDESKLVVSLFSDLSGKPLQLEGEQAALFLENIAHLEGCWAFNYSNEDEIKIKLLLNSRETVYTNSSSSIDEESPDSPEEPEPEKVSYSAGEKILDKSN